MWGDVPGEAFSNQLDNAYNQMVHWRPNLFKFPSGSVGKKLVGEMSRLFKAFTTESALEAIALKAVMTLPALVLQKPDAKSKLQEHISCLRRRLAIWENGELAELLKEGRVIQGALRNINTKNTNVDGAACKFSKLMMQVKIRSALRSLSDDSGLGPLQLEDVLEGSGKTVTEILKEKHPHALPPHPDALLGSTDADNNFHPVIFDCITPEVIRRAALETEGSAGPSGMDALCWRHLCTAFGEKPNDLCSSIASFTRRICTTYVDPECLTAYTSCRLIPLNKNPGVRPVGVGEVVRRIVGKAIMKVVKGDLQESIGSIQLCGGQDAGCEAAVHAMGHLFADSDTEAMILVDATNAFNRLNRQVTLLNCDEICPAMTHILINSYRNHSFLYVDGQCLLSEEGTTQSDPLAMAMYAIGIQPLICKLDGIVKQSWYADDSAAASSLEQLRRWWDLLNELVPQYGYFLNGVKTHILAKPQYLDKARELFQDTSMTISDDGEVYLGGAMGTNAFAEHFVKKKVEGWVKEVEKLSKFAKTQRSLYMPL